MVLADVLTFLKTATKPELDQVITLAQNQRQLVSRMSFNIGDDVKFDAKTRGIITGKITKMNAKTFHVLSSNGVDWRVSPSALIKA